MVTAQEILSMVNEDHSSDYAEDINGWLDYSVHTHDGRYWLVIKFHDASTDLVHELASEVFPDSLETYPYGHPH